MVKTLLVLIAIIVHSNLPAQTLGFVLADGKNKVEIPIEINNNLVVVPVVLNDALPLKFILDTGVRTAILTQKTFTDILNLAYSRKYSITGPGGLKTVEAYVTNNVSLELPGVRGSGHALLVLEQDYLELRNYMGTDVHGILGYELFSRFIVNIDYEKRILTLMSPKKFRKKRKFETIRISVEDTKPYIAATVTQADGTSISAKLLMDSGASHGLMLDPSADGRINVPGNAVSSMIGRGLGGAIVGKVGRIESLKIGSFLLDDAIANFPDPNSYIDSLKLGNIFRHGTIGGEILSRFNVIFNFSKEEIYLKKNTAFKKPFHYNLSGITVKAKGSKLDVFEVMEVRSKSVADAVGILPGDIILAINGIGSSNLNLNQVHNFFNAKPGKKVKIELNRKGEILKKEFELADQI